MPTKFGPRREERSPGGGEAVALPGRQLPRALPHLPGAPLALGLAPAKGLHQPAEPAGGLGGGCVGGWVTGWMLGSGWVDVGGYGWMWVDVGGCGWVWAGG